MSTNPRQFQGSAADRPATRQDYLRGVAPRVDAVGFEEAAYATAAARRCASAQQDGLVPASNLSISSWYAISGTAMA